MNISKSDSLFQKTCELIPGGVNSPVRAFKGVGGTPRVISHGQGAYLFDVDGNRYIDYVLSWGPLIHGHAHPAVIEAIVSSARRGTSFGAPTELEFELAKRITDLFPSMDMIRFVNSGSEATMSALRLARAFTKRDQIIKFSGCYHGHADSLLTKSSTRETAILPYNDLQAVADHFKQFPNDVAGIIVEPIAGNMGFVAPEPGFLKGLQDLCQANGALLIFDEVMTGFRAAYPGTQTFWNITPDITCLGKVIGGGLPVAAYGGRRDIMQTVAPLGPMYQAGTLSGNPLGMAAGIASLDLLSKPGVFNSIEQKMATLVAGIRDIAQQRDIRVQIHHIGTMFGMYFLNDEAPNIKNPVTSYELAKKYVDSKRYAKFFHQMLEHGCYLAPSAFEAGFLSAAHSEDDIQKTLDAACLSFT